jgi:uncharacterized protein YbaP (TraB family)
MRYRKRRAWCLALVLATTTAFAQDAPRHFLWKVEAPDGASAYLLGSLHVLTADYYPLSPAIDKAFAASETLVEEVDLDEMNDPAQMMSALSKAMLTDGTSLADLVSADTYANVSKRAGQSGVPLAALDRMKPWLVAVALMGPTLQAAGFKPELGVDKHYFDRAKQAGLKRRSLETLAFQTDRFDRLSPKLQEQMLKATLDELDTQVGNVKDLARAWASGDVAAMEALLLAAFKGSPEIYDSVLVERNRNWLAHVDTCLTERAGCFIVVGAAHLVGPDGLPALLQKKGYKVTQQ